MKLNNKTKTAYAYLRVGSIHQVASGTSIDNQKEELKRYCRKNNIRLVDVFSDCPESANNFNRRGFVRMLGRNVIRPTDYIVATDIDRISRNNIEYFKLKNKLEKLGTHFLFPNGLPSDLLEAVFKTMNYWSDVVRKKKNNGDCDCE